MKDIANLIKSQRQRLGLSQTELSERATVSLPTIQNIEAGRANPSLSTVSAILAELGVRLTCIRENPDWDYLASLGLDCVAHRTTSVLGTESEFRRQLHLGLQALVQEGSRMEAWPRRRQSMAALLAALQQHFPGYYRANFVKAPLVAEFLIELPNDLPVDVAASTLRRLAEVL